MLIGYLSANSFNFDAVLQNKRGGKQCDASVIRIKVCDYIRVLSHLLHSMSLYLKTENNLCWKITI